MLQTLSGSGPQTHPRERQQVTGSVLWERGATHMTSQYGERTGRRESTREKNLKKKEQVFLIQETLKNI